MDLFVGKIKRKKLVWGLIGKRYGRLKKDVFGLKRRY